ncbi:hypothetical protein LCGC14_0690040 [marine sediment metagenome]|uniref:Uncharacterized protein n=1 Tax=marine sediment metagenome TaxID=412755 RepID=A0A0F9QKQ1_9ZZZZ|nr:hypothetical protein [Candidatus Aminicenantes bacterium]
MAREPYRIKPTENLQDLVVDLNTILQRITIQLQRIEGFDGYSTELFGPIKHTGTTIGFYSATPVVQADAISDSAGSSGQNQTAINAILPVLRNLGVIANA